MNASGQVTEIRNLLPEEVFESLRGGNNAVLVDVRTLAEWSYVGLPDLSAFNGPLALVEWHRFGEKQINPEFVTQLRNQINMSAARTIYFICRSGQRSLDAAKLVQADCNARGEQVECINVAGGFEGDLDEAGHRGSKNGWKLAGLPWRQT